jgi:hypothetical protein
LILKNKKLIDENIIEFVYNGEVFNNQINNSMTLLKEKYKSKIDKYDKVVIYKFCTENKNIHLYKNIINDFIVLIKLLNSKNKDNEIKGETKIYEVLNDIKDSISKEFIKLFEQQNELTIGKTPELFDYYLRVIFEGVNKEIKKYQKNLDKNSKDLINKYYKSEQLINKKDFAYAIRLFITLVLIREDEDDKIKIKKIKNNNNNIMKYLKSPDFWKKGIYNDDNFSKNINELKSMNFKVNQIVYLYETLGKDIEKNFFEDEIRLITEENDKNKSDEGEEEEEEEEEEKEKDDPFDEEGIRD